MLAGKISISISDTNTKSSSVNALDTRGDVEIKELFKFIKSKLIEISLLALREEQSNGFDKNPIQVVDGDIKKPLENVKPFGKVSYVSRASSMDIFLSIYDGLVKRSPYDEGNYIAAHFVYVNQKLVATNRAALENFVKTNELKGGDIVRFVDVVPYAGKLEREGTTGAKKTNHRLKKSKDKPKFRSGPMVRAPNGAYYLTAKQVVRKYGFNSKIEFQWVNGSNLDLSAAPTHSKAGKKFRRTFADRGRGSRKGSYAYPSIVIFINKEGLL